MKYSPIKAMIKGFFLIGFCKSLPALPCTAEADIKPNCCIGPTLCGAGPKIDNCYDNLAWDLEIDFILEQARLTGTQTAYSFTEEGFTRFSRILRPSFDLEWGVTAGVGWLFSEDNWFLGARFDWLESTATSFKTGQIVPVNLSLNLGVDQGYSEFSSKLQVNYYMLDILLCRGSYISGCLAFDPHLGIKSAWFYYRGFFSFLDTNIAPPFTSQTLKRLVHTNSWGVGPEIGVDLDWNLAEGFSLYGESGFALLFGQSSIKDTDIADRPPLFPDREYWISKEKREVAIPSLRLTLGFKISSYFCENRHYVFLKIAFDSVFYWNQYDHIDDFVAISSPVSILESSVVTSDNNSLSLMGLKVVFGWIF